MAFTIARVPDGINVVGRDRQITVDITITGTYTAGGYTIAARDVGLKFFKAVKVAGGDVSQLTYYPFFDFALAVPGGSPITGKLRFGTATATEATGTISPTIQLRLEITGQ